MAHTSAAVTRSTSYRSMPLFIEDHRPGGDAELSASHIQALNDACARQFNNIDPRYATMGGDKIMLVIDDKGEPSVSFPE